MKIEYIPEFEIKLTETNNIYKLIIEYDDEKEWDMKGIKQIKDCKKELYLTKNFGKIIDDIIFKCNEFGLLYEWTKTN